MYLAVRKILALLTLAAFAQAFLPSLLHQVLPDEDEVHVWCPEHDRLEHLHSPGAKAQRAAGNNSDGSRLDLRRDFSEQHTPCPLYCASSASCTTSRPSAASVLDCAGELSIPATFITSGLLPIRYAPKTSPPAHG